jgi:tartrate-resistant acid phosphatase type 5
MKHELTTMNRRQFLRSTFAFSALAASGNLSHAFAAAPDKAAHHTLMFGDWGREDQYDGQRSVANGMVRYASQNHIKTDALFMLGDAWYGALDGGVDSPRFKDQFESMYPPAAFPGPAYSIMGNHDYQHMPQNINKRDTELAYSARGNTRWTQPSLWYSFDLPNMRVIALDSNVHHAIKKEDTVNFTLTEQEQATQLAWFKAELAKPTKAPFTVVMGHHPIYSDGPHGDHAVLIADWEPLLREHKVSLYLAGHDHDLQHLEFEGHPTSFVCSGAGGADLYDLKITPDQRGPYAKKVYGFTHLESSAEKLTIRHIGADGNVLHGFTKSKDGTVKLLA